MRFCKCKKSQLFILSTFLLCILLLFIYSLETQKNYIVHLDKKSSVVSFQKEMCQVVKMSNGSNLAFRLENFSKSQEEFCNNIFGVCKSELYLTQPLPSIQSLINSSYFLVELEISSQSFFLKRNFSC